MLRPGKHDDTTPSSPTPNATDLTMAELMEKAFLEQWPHFNGTLPEPTEKQLKPMRLLFVAVAQGVVQHLREHPEAFNVNVTSTDHSHSGGTHVHGNGSHSHSAGTHDHPAEVDTINTTGTTN